MERIKFLEALNESGIAKQTIKQILREMDAVELSDKNPETTNKMGPQPNEKWQAQGNASEDTKKKGLEILYILSQAVSNPKYTIAPQFRNYNFGPSDTSNLDFKGPFSIYDDSSMSRDNSIGGLYLLTPDESRSGNLMLVYKSTNTKMWKFAEIEKSYIQLFNKTRITNHQLLVYLRDPGKWSPIIS